MGKCGDVAAGLGRSLALGRKSIPFSPDSAHHWQYRNSGHSMLPGRKFKLSQKQVIRSAIAPSTYL